jgi:very-short-patch-repair endonuclease
MRRIHPEIRKRARELRQPQTAAEATLWRVLQNRKLGYKFRRQHPIGPFIVDFYCAEAGRLVIEIDGSSHMEQEEYDAERTAWLESQGYHVIRFNNTEVRYQLNEVVQAILEACSAAKPAREPSEG